MLTKRQKQILDYIKKFIDKNDYAPTLEEIRRHFRLSSVSTIHQHIEAIKSKGYLDKLENHPRAINITKQKSILEIPLLGIITAGKPIEAIEIPNETITIPKNELGKFGKHYALRVQGNSMINEGISDGDIVIIRKQASAENGQTVVAIIDDNEATLKKIYREKNRIRLQPANPTLFPFYRNEVEIRGIVVKVIRNLESSIEKEYTEGARFRRRIDYSWDFRREKTKSYTHGFHTYPAMFIPQIARRLLLNYSKKGDTICDIFCGSGTALVESRLRGRNSYGIELNPLAVFLAKVKTTEINPSKLTKAYFSLLNKIQKIRNGEIDKPKFFNIDFWFKNKVIIELARIKKAIQTIRENNIKNFFFISFSQTVRLSSNTKSGEFKLVRIPQNILKKHNPNVLGIFKKQTESNISGMAEFSKNVDRKMWAKIILGDSSKSNGVPASSIDCIITSPPYGDSRTTVAYGQFSRLSAQWIDIFDDPNKASEVDKKLLGGKAAEKLEHTLQSEYLNEALSRIAKKDETRAKDVLSFYIDLNKCLKQAYTILKKNKYFCLVIGNRLVKQVRIPTDFIIAELGEKIGFACEDIVVRNIPNKRMPLKNSPTNIAGKLENTMSKESIVILRKIS